MAMMDYLGRSTGFLISSLTVLYLDGIKQTLGISIYLKKNSIFALAYALYAKVAFFAGEDVFEDLF